MVNIYIFINKYIYHVPYTPFIHILFYQTLPLVLKIYVQNCILILCVNYAKIVVHNVGDYSTVWNTTQNNFGMVGNSKECFLHCGIQCGRLFCGGGYTVHHQIITITQNNIFLTLRAFHSPSLAKFNQNHL